ncbi:hypothetical protein CSOJ01_01519 [Colletotrichum sojae]|uniref:Uncharacterized protein n=1 Tax=Colletotrichum sojae TaxID=2175907 RepID=A0A8H6JTM9_9PEZI|nr:hypothetical protein CSOJ01_01519 [Colletotrichum sojae]
MRTAKRKPERGKEHKPVLVQSKVVPANDRGDGKPTSDGPETRLLVKPVNVTMLSSCWLVARIGKPDMRSSLHDADLPYQGFWGCAKSQAVLQAAQLAPSRLRCLPLTQSTASTAQHSEGLIDAHVRSENGHRCSYLWPLSLTHLRRRAFDASRFFLAVATTRFRTTRDKEYVHTHYPYFDPSQEDEDGN